MINKNFDSIKADIVNKILNNKIDEINNNKIINGLNDLSSLFEFDNEFYENFQNPKNIVIDLNNWDVSNVINMNSMFKNCPFQFKISNWNTSKVKNMSCMFQGALNFNCDIDKRTITLNNDNIDVDKIRKAASSVDSTVNHTNKEIERSIKEFSNKFKTTCWNTSNVTDMSYMFNNATSFNKSISNWDTSNVTDMTSMFEEALSFNQDLNSEFFKSNNGIITIAWNTSNVKKMDKMFKNAKSFEGNISLWNTSNVETMESMFQGAIKFNCDINIKKLNDGIIAWNTSNVINMSSMFKDAISFNENISNWNTSNVKTMKSMFEGASIFNQNINRNSVINKDENKIKYISWDTSNVTDMSYMFKDAKLFNQSLSYWNTSNVENMTSMFEGASEFNQNINIKNVDENEFIAWDTSNVKSMKRMFSNALKFNGDIYLWNVDNLIDMIDMFNNANDFDYMKINTKINYLLDREYIAWKINPDLVLHNINIDDKGLNWNNNKSFLFLYDLYDI